jgi:hypothetical protein
VTEDDEVLLDKVLEAGRPLAPSDLDDGSYFALFVAEQVLEAYDLSTDELLGGICGGGGGDDGGIDGLYVFADGRLIADEADLGSPREGIDLSLVVFQAKTARGFDEKPIRLLANTLADLLDLSLTSEDLEQAGLYSSLLIAVADLVRCAIAKSAGKRPRVSVAIAYATKGDSAEISPKVHERAIRLEDQITAAIPGAAADVTFHGARELRQLSQRVRSERLELVVEGALPDEENGYVALVALEDYCRFLRDETGALRRYIFDGNVRDSQGDIEVNNAIAASLNDPGAPQFWWLNNGVTILASDVSTVGEKLYVDSPRIVDGLQTSIVIHETLPADDGADVKSGRRLLVRIICASDAGTRDRIIRSTNSQTRVSTASLRATDGLQREIELYFLHEGWFYDRRKSNWKNEGRPAERIVQITYLAQAVLAICLADPASARARPSSLLEDDVDYGRIFDPQRERSIYLWAASTQKHVDAFLRSEDGVTREEIANLRFHLATMLVAEALGRRVDANRRDDVASLVGREFTAGELRAALRELRESMASYRVQTRLGMDRVAKSGEFVEAMLVDNLPTPSLRLVVNDGVREASRDRNVPRP